MPCRMGKKQNCENLYALGVNTNGGFAEYALCPETQCLKIDDKVDLSEDETIDLYNIYLEGIHKVLQDACNESC